MGLYEYKGFFYVPLQCSQVERPQRRRRASFVNCPISQSALDLRHFLCPPRRLLLYLEMDRPVEEWRKKHVRLRALYFSYHSALKWNYNGGGRFPSNGERSTRGEGGRLAGREGGGRIYYTFISVCNDAERILPLLLTRIIIANEWNSAAHIKRHAEEPYHNARSHVGPLFWCLLRSKGFSKPDTCWLLL